MVKLVDYSESSGEEDAGSDSSHWGSFGNLPSDSEDSLSFPMRTPESESDEDYAPSEASEASSVATEDLEFPGEAAEEEMPVADAFSAAKLDEQEQEEKQEDMFYAWEDLKAAFDDNPFKRRSVEKQEEAKPERRILHARKKAASPKFSTDGLFKEKEKFSTPEGTTVYSFTSQTGANAVGAEQAKVDSTSDAKFSIGKPSPKTKGSDDARSMGKTSEDAHMMSPPPTVATAPPSEQFPFPDVEFTIGKPSPKVFSKATEDTHMMSPPPPVATATASTSNGFVFGDTNPTRTDPSAFSFARSNSAPTHEAEVKTSDEDDARMRSPSPQARTPTHTETETPFTVGDAYKNRKPFHFVEFNGNEFHFGSDVPSSQPTFSQPPRSAPSTVFGTNTGTQSAAFFTPGVASPTQRQRNGRRRKLNGSNTFTSAPRTNVDTPHVDAPSRSESPFTAPTGLSKDDTDASIPHAPEIPFAENTHVGSTGGHFLFRKANSTPARPSPLQTSAFGTVNDSSSPVNADTVPNSHFTFNSSHAPATNGANLGATAPGFRIGTAESKATARTRYRKGGMFTSKTSPKGPPKPAVAAEPEPSPGIFSSTATATPAAASPFGMRSSRARNARLRRRMGRSPPADPFVVPTFNSQQPSLPTEAGQPEVVRPTANRFTFGVAGTAENKNGSAAQAYKTSNAQGAFPFPQPATSLPNGFTSPNIHGASSAPKSQRTVRPAFAGSRRILHAALRKVGTRPGDAASTPSRSQKPSGLAEDKGDADMVSEEDDIEWGELKRLGGVAYASRRYSEASEYYRQSIEVLEGLLEHNTDMATHELMTDKAKLHANRAASLMMLTQIPEAQRECRRSIEEDPTYARAYLRLGRIQILLGDTVNAQANLDTAKHLMAGDMGANGASNDQADQAQLHKMEASIKKLVSLQGEIKWYTDCGDYKQALAHTDNALLVAPSCRKLQVQKARILLHQKEFDQIVEFCSGIVEKQAVHDRKSRSNHHSLRDKTVGDIKFVGIALGLLWATSLHYRNSVEDAVRILEALEVVAPCSSDVVQLKHQWRDMKKMKHDGNERFKRGEYQEAVRYYSEAVQIDPQHEEYCAVIYCNRAAAQMALERYHTAILDCNEALQRKPNYPRALLRRARCHVALKMYHEAVKDFDQYLREHPSSSTSDNSDDVRRERNEAKAAIAKAREEARQREAAKKRAEREQRQRRQQRWENPWDDGRFYDNFRHNNSSSGNRHKASGFNSRSSFMAPKTQRRTHYDVLGIEKTSTVDQIKKAYRKLALVYHPDKAKTSTHADLFKDMTAAYNVLSDESARAKYDRELIYNRFGNYYES